MTKELNKQNIQTNKQKKINKREDKTRQEEVEEKRRVFFSSSDYTMYYFSFNQSLFIIN